MITKVSPIKLYSNNFVSKREQYNPAFGAVRLYNERSSIDVFKLHTNKMFKDLSCMWNKFIKSFSSNRVVDNNEITVNNKFIAKIQNKISSYGVPAGEFRTKNGDVISIKMLKDGNKKVDFYYSDDVNKKFPIRTVIVDDYGFIQRYETSYPWRVFVKDGKDYLCAENTDKYFKDIASSPLYKWYSAKQL